MTRGIAVRKFSPQVEELRKIVTTKSHGVSPNVRENEYGNIVYRARYEKAIVRVASLVRSGDGQVLGQGRLGKIRRDAAGRTVDNEQPFYIEFTMGTDEDVFILTGTRLDKMEPKVTMGRMCR